MKLYLVNNCHLCLIIYILLVVVSLPSIHNSDDRCYENGFNVTEKCNLREKKRKVIAVNISHLLKQKRSDYNYLFMTIKYT